MEGQAYPVQRSDGPLWMAAFCMSLLLNGLLLAMVGLGSVKSWMVPKPEMAATVPPPPTESVATVFAEFTPPSAAAQEAADAKQRFARTSEDQASAPHESKPAFMGERNTRATSDRAPDPSASPLPSQAGVTPQDKEDIETTESRYQDGSLSGSERPSPDANPEPAPVPPSTAQAQAEMPAEKPPSASTTTPAALPGTDAEQSVPPPREKLLEGPNPVDVMVPKPSPPSEDPIQPKPESRALPPEPPAPPAPAERPTVSEAPKPKPSKDPAFKGYQRKTAVIGSISRTGRSALDVEDSPLGRYQAAISRAVEQEWQRNCVRHRDFITPGFLTVRFFVEGTGKVRSVQFVGEMETGEVQKGFTLNSIRNAEIPVMPPAIRKEYDKEPLELVFRFYF